MHGQVRVRWGLGCLNIENNPRWVVSPPGPALLWLGVRVRVRVRVRVSLFCNTDV